VDTDDLSRDAYDAVILTAEKFHPDLTLQFGLMADDYSSEDDYLKEIKNLVSDLQKHLQSGIDEIFFDNPPQKKDFKAILIDINNNIDKVLRTPFEKRKFDKL